jgi:hypothetical protein
MSGCTTAVDQRYVSGFDDAIAALVICGAARWRVLDGAITGLDLIELRHDHQQAARAGQTAA